MCLIFSRDNAGGRLDWGLLRRAHERNPHGVGILYRALDQWNVERAEDWPWEAVRDVLAAVDRLGAPWAVHFRWRTRGGLGKHNVHPFSLGKGRWLMHNGTLPVVGLGDESDSAALARRVRSGGMTLAAAARLATESNSRLLVGHRDGRIDLVGTWFKRSSGWLSNDRCMLRSCEPLVFSKWHNPAEVSQCS